MKDYVMMVCVSGKDHALSFGPRVALPGLLRDHLLPTGTEKSRNRQSMTNAETETGTQTSPFLGHHVARRTHGSAVEEWQPHRPQGDRSAEWWNLTATVCDPAGTRYFLSWTVTHPGRRRLGQQPPQVITQIKPGQGLYACRFTLISYQASIREAGVPTVFVINDHDAWDAETSTLSLRDAQHEHECAWSFDGERMNLAVSSPTLAFNLKIQGGSQVMWAEDQPRAAGLDRHGADGRHSFSYSLPHLQITGSVTYTDERGKPTAVDVSGSGWADRQWGDFLAGLAQKLRWPGASCCLMYCRMMHSGASQDARCFGRCLRRSGAPGTAGGIRRCRGPAPDPARWLPMGHLGAGLLPPACPGQSTFKGKFPIFSAESISLPGGLPWRRLWLSRDKAAGLADRHCPHRPAGGPR